MAPIYPFRIINLDTGSETLGLSGMYKIQDHYVQTVLHVSGINVATGYSELNVGSEDMFDRIAAVVPQGIATKPTSAANLYSNYCKGNGQNNSQRIKNFFLKNNDGTYSHNGLWNEIAISKVQNVPGDQNSLLLPISGNGIYTVYSAIVLLPNRTSDLKVITSLSNVADYRLCAPSPDLANDVTFEILDQGITLSNAEVQTIRINFNTVLKNFAYLDNFGVGYPGLAASGYAEVYCSGVNEGSPVGKLYPAVYGGFSSLASSVYEAGKHIPQYAIGSGPTLQWQLPIYKYDENTGTFSDTEYATYDFIFTYFNSEGKASPQIRKRFQGWALKNLHEGLETGTISSATMGEELTGPNFIEIEPPPAFRKRLAIGIQDIDIESVIYKQRGSFISLPYNLEDPIYAVTLNATEQFPIKMGGYKPWDFVKYYIQFGSDDNAEWHRISPKQRMWEVDDSGVVVPSVIILDSNLNNAERFLMTDSTKFVDIKKPTYVYRIKIEMDTVKSNESKAWSPVIHDYEVELFSRNALLNGAVEKRIFS